MNLKGIQKTIEKIGAGLPPDEDWVPALIVENEKESAVYGFVGDAMEDSTSKDVVAEAMTNLIAKFKPNCACFVTTAWTIHFEKAGLDEFDVELFKTGAMKIKDHPKRVEIVNAYVYDITGPKEVESLMFGYIERSKDKGPKIKKWEIIEEGASAEGRFPDAIKQGFYIAGLNKGG